MIRKSLLSAAIVLASANVCSTAFANFVVPPQSNWPFFVTAGVGGSWSRKIDADVFQHPLEWDPAPIEGYDGDIGSSELWTAGFGYRFSNLVALSVDVTRRPSYEYSRFQTGYVDVSTGVAIDIPDKTRYFDFANTSVMFDLTLYGSGFGDWFMWGLGNCVFLEPYVGVGVGVAYNNISNFHSVWNNTPFPPFDLEAHTFENAKTFREFAWQATVGLRLTLNEHVSFDAGYRYFDGGKFHSNNYDWAVGLDNLSATNVPWNMKFRAHEGYVNMNYMFG